MVVFVDARGLWGLGDRLWNVFMKVVIGVVCGVKHWCDRFGGNM